MLTAGFDDVIEVMPSLQRPKKIVFLGSDGKKYPFLCKPHDDLRKDARLMDFNSMINKLLNSASESRRRNLHIRTYAVMPLNEECGLLEWVPNTTALRSILEKGYSRHGKKLYVGFSIDDADLFSPAKYTE
jgi:serine/threonine-protein kinase ATR